MADQFQPTLHKLDELINNLEVSTGSPHQPIPVPKVNSEATAQPQQSVAETNQKGEKLAEFPATEAKPENEKKEKKKAEEKQEEKNAKKSETKTESKTEPKVEKKKEQELGEPTIEDFALIDIRVGEIKECWKHPESENLYCEKIDIGEENVREIGSGLQKHVSIDMMSGPVLVMSNLKARKLAGFMSNGMVMANSNEDHSQIKLVVPKDSKVGERVVLEGFQEKFSQEKQPELNPKKKILEKCLGKFSTDAEGAAMWNGHKLRTSAGIIMCPIPNGKLS